ncbi:hypothetical protein, partial [Salmonella enterica]|uniref:hypothetical protein n=1 Tax=Salmonella enterica TaxID=28901 RepID=UPI00398C5420
MAQELRPTGTNPHPCFAIHLKPVAGFTVFVTAGVMVCTPSANKGFWFISIGIIVISLPHHNLLKNGIVSHVYHA